MSDINVISKRLRKCRTEILNDYPFFGRLLLRMPLAFAECGTAYTDMQRIVFDPSFAERLDDQQLKFILLHEVLHCVLRHCIRGHSFNQMLYNISCDIVVNSLILEMFGVSRFEVEGAEPMNKAPDGTEGRLHSAEEIYYQFLDKYSLQDVNVYTALDSHSTWDTIDENTAVRLSDEWDRNIREAAGDEESSGYGVPCSLQRYIKQVKNSQIDWRQVLQDFIRYDRADFTYTRPDTRYQGDIIMPSFMEDQYGERVENIWVLIDTSGSISSDTLVTAFSEIRGAVEQIDSLKGKLSFFDTEVTEPIEFSSVEDLEKIKPLGGGGTSFKVIFEPLKNNMFEELPTLIIILTDGYASFPPEEATMSVPVLWILFDSWVSPPWGETVYVI